MITINKKIVYPQEQQKVEDESVMLHQIHRSVLAGAPLTRESHECAAVLSSLIALYGSSPAGSSFHQQIQSQICSSSSLNAVTMDVMIPKGEDKSDHRSTETQQKVCPRETALLQLSLIKAIITKALCSETDECIRHKYTEIIWILLKQIQIDSKIISLLGCADKLLVHTASKCMAYLIIFQLKAERKVNEAWLCFCLELFSDPAKDALVERLSSFLDVLKSIFKDRQLHVLESLPTLLSPLDATLEDLYDFLLSPSSSRRCQSSSLDSRVGSNLSSFLDVFEVLIAFRGRLMLCLRCQRILFLKPSQFLALIASAVPYFIKKKLVLLLKKCLLSKAGEDLSAPLPPCTFPDTCLEEDMLTLARGILQAVNSGWLQQVAVDRKNSYFGGSATILEQDAHTSPDTGILRALSLTLLKALEIKFQYLESGIGVKAELQSFMSRLLEFLQTCLQRPRLEHTCEWTSLIFIEQDDDMVEAVKTLLALYLECERSCSKSPADLHLGGEDAMETSITHENGYNPHCLFLIFLNNIMFDATVLLDFLISSETCFLEYFVRYLKLLKGDWPHFCQVCQRFCASAVEEPLFVCESGASNPERSSSWTASSGVPETHECVPPSLIPAQNPHVTVRKKRGEQSVKPSRSDTSLGAPQNLVDYDSSEESELEALEKECGLNINRSSGKPSESCKIRRAVIRNAGRGINRPDLKTNGATPKYYISSLQQTWCDSGTPSEGPLLRSMRCLEELRKAVSRLHRRSLFPYNPTALLKLLLHIEALAGRTD